MAKEPSARLTEGMGSRSSSRSVDFILALFILWVEFLIHAWDLVCTTLAWGRFRKCQSLLYFLYGAVETLNIKFWSGKFWFSLPLWSWKRCLFSLGLSFLTLKWSLTSYPTLNVCKYGPRISSVPLHNDGDKRLKIVRRGNDHKFFMRKFHLKLIFCAWKQLIDTLWLSHTYSCKCQVYV